MVIKAGVLTPQTLYSSVIAGCFSCVRLCLPTSLTVYIVPGPDPVSQSDPRPSVPLCLLSVCIIRCDVRDGTAGMSLPSFYDKLTGQQLIISGLKWLTADPG